MINICILYLNEKYLCKKIQKERETEIEIIEHMYLTYLKPTEFKDDASRKIRNE